MRGTGEGLLARVAQIWVAFSAYRRTAEGASAALTGADMGVSLGAGSVARVAGSATAWGACDAGAWAIAAARAAAIAISSSKSSQAAAADSEKASAVAAAARHFRIAIACLLSMVRLTLAADLAASAAAVGSRSREAAPCGQPQRASSGMPL